MADYLILIYSDETRWSTMDQASYEALYAAHDQFQQRNAAKIKAGQALQGTDTATSIREGVVTDGAFAETKEALGGFYLVDAADLDEAIALAKQVPAPNGGVEVRPIQVID